MTDSSAELARLMKVSEAIVAELERQGVADAVADLGFDPMRMAKAVIRAADGDVVPFPGATRPGPTSSG
ncbi:hypothetical protein FXV83_16255 [Bradyrhizobium hipponense]|uniref:Uncharacterized protein n=1 Tax=Bradyrhizobium hipponense TaxID=2605638 RepID=A0A5S4YPX6_9BRAD|nr:hypothetical protein [Bradyrhizobium hipponense]TYO65487.1 hypothetical protein FXV83_16255 [Bradyrhizobium hipponense]